MNSQNIIDKRMHFRFEQSQIFSSNAVFFVVDQVEAFHSFKQIRNQDRRVKIIVHGRKKPGNQFLTSKEELVPVGTFSSKFKASVNRPNPFSAASNAVGVKSDRKSTRLNSSHS